MITPEDWRSLEAEVPGDQDMSAREVSPGNEILIARGREGGRHLLLPVDDEAAGCRDTRSRGLKAETKRLDVQDRPRSWYIDVRATDPTAYDVFNKIVNNILEAVERGEAYRTAVKAVLERWRRFWASVPEEGLAPDALRGLFGELWFLATHLLPDDPKQLWSWTGPSGTRHDFQWPGCAIEAKTTGAVRGHVHWINGLDQLDPPEDGRLFLYSLRVRLEASAHNSVPGLIQSIYGLLQSDAQLLDYFDQQLAGAGYSPLHNDRYSQVHWRVVDEAVFAVDPSFPRLSASMIQGGLPAAVKRVDYVLDLSSVWQSGTPGVPRLPPAPAPSAS